MINLQDIVFTLTGQKPPLLDNEPHLKHAISSAVIDSRQAQPGSLFIALPGERVDGHDYIQSALNNGAILALTEKDPPEGLNTLDLRPDFFDPQYPYGHRSVDLSLPLCLRVHDSLLALQTIASTWRDQHPLRTIGITGSVGKTSTKELTAALLAQKFSVLKNSGNRNNEIGLPLTLLELQDHHEYAVLEMGFYVPGEIQTLCEIAKPQVGMITNIGTVHAERAGSQEMIAKGKAELVQSLPASPEGVAILNMDDPWVRKMANMTQAQVFTYGITEKSDLNAMDIQTHGLDGVSCVLSYHDQEHAIRSPLLGAFSVYTILCAVAVALTEGLDWHMIVSGLAESRLDLRMHAFTLADKITILDDTYNASPTSTIAALELLRELTGRRVAILGDMLELGPYEYSGHESVGLVAATAADILILVGKRTKTIADTAVANGFAQENVHWFLNSTQAAEQITDLITHGDMVLIKGSNSMRMDRILTALAGGV
jgi:UDP-N-acetylmuramoyl-tripeptide--D-alanyl-D-alanine ligase